MISVCAVKTLASVTRFGSSCVFEPMLLTETPNTSLLDISVIQVATWVSANCESSSACSVSRSPDMCVVPCSKVST